MNELPLLSLQRRKHTLADPTEQKLLLADATRLGGTTFAERIAQTAPTGLRRDTLQTLQVNLGRVCNQTCSHCHVDAGPDRRESMSHETVDDVITFLSKSSVGTLDITGGAPEMNPHFRRLVLAARQLGKHVIDRCNLTILLANGYDDMAAFLAAQGVRIIASLPCYLAENCDAQRGQGVFNQSIEAIRRLNELGYARDESTLELDLVYNPTGLSLPPAQGPLERAYREQLQTRYGIHFNRLQIGRAHV